MKNIAASIAILLALCGASRAQDVVIPHVPSTEEIAANLEDIGFGGGGTIVAPGTNGTPVTNAVTVTRYVEGANVDIEQTVNGSTSTVTVSASSAIAGPQGAAGVGNMQFYGSWVTNTPYSTNAVVTYGGSTYYSIHGITSPTPPSADTTNWVVGAAAGTSGTSGTNGLDGAGLVYRGAWSGGNLTTNDIVSYQGSSYVPKTNLTPSDDPSTSTNYNVFVAGGDDGASGNVVSNLFFAGTWVAGTAYPSNSVVAYSERAYYANTAITGTLYVAPGTHAGWTLFIDSGADGSDGQDGSDGVSMVYDNCYDASKTYQSNTVVHYPCSGKKNLYRAREVTSGATPNISPSQWEEIISSGEDANVTQWVFSDSYNASVTYSNALVLYGGATYYTKQVTVGNTPAIGAYWGLLVTNGTPGASGTNGMNGANGSAGPTNMAFVGSWVAGTYTTNQIVTWNGSAFYVNTESTTSEPPASGWATFISKGDTGPVNTTYVTNLFITNVVSYTYLTNQIVTNITWVTNTFNYTNVSYTSIITVVTNTYTATNVYASVEAYSDSVNGLRTSPSNSSVLQYCLTNGGGAAVNNSPYTESATAIISPTSGAHTIAGDGSHIGGGLYNSSTGRAATVAGGNGNQALGWYSSVGGGQTNVAGNTHSSVVGGQNVQVYSPHSIAFGQDIFISGDGDDGRWSVAFGGRNRLVSSQGSFVSGLENAITNAQHSSISGGYRCWIDGPSSYRSAIAGGSECHIGGSSSLGSFIGAGLLSAITNSELAALVGGYGNVIVDNGDYGFIGGGISNRVTGVASVALGAQAEALHSGSFVWSDWFQGYTGTAFKSSSSNQFLIQASGGVGIGTNAPVPGGLSVAGPIVGVPDYASIAMPNGLILAVTTSFAPVTNYSVSSLSGFTADLTRGTVTVPRDGHYQLNHGMSASSAGAAAGFQFIMTSNGNDIATTRLHATLQGGAYEVGRTIWNLYLTNGTILGAAARVVSGTDTVTFTNYSINVTRLN